MFDSIVIGAGAAGMMAASAATLNGSRVLLLEKNDRPGRKIRITGKGRCNVTNDCDPQEVIRSATANSRFLYSCVHNFTPADTMAYFESLGVPLKTERGNRVFPVSDNAQDIVDAMAGYCENLGVEMRYGCNVTAVMVKDGTVVGVKLRSGEVLEAGRVLIACGGSSYAVTGSDGSGVRLAKQAGHTITKILPSLVPLVAEGEDCSAMMGLSLRNIAVTVEDTETKKTVFEDFGELLFTHFGLSGPTILSASAHMRSMSPGRYRVHIDLKPALSAEQLDARLLRDFEKNKNRLFSNSLGELLPAKMIPVIVRRSGIGEETRCNGVTKEQRRNFGALLKNFTVDIRDFRPINEAIVTSGGVDVKEVNPKTMESKLISGLYFAGEVLDLDAYTGGFNLQIAFSTGYAAGQQL
ncbi:MAG: NAD(P)/FAD-dependent oxidoreductase [Clostridia bacterium]|nr:NAD(P)/FAD-dependent oxidoreductase [Clostridia bacterium]